MLRNPEYEHVRSDTALASDLGALLEEQQSRAKTDGASIQLRVFLCRALGEFQVPQAISPLLSAANQESSPEEIDVRRAAVEAIAVYAGNHHVADPRLRSEILNTLERISQEPPPVDRQDDRRDELRSASAYALGILGGAKACDRLALMLSDAHPNTRYNAATGLARHGDPRCVDVLREMLDPDNRQALREEESEAGQHWKQRLILENAIRATRQFASQNSGASVAPLIAALDELQEAPLNGFPNSARRELRMHVDQVLRQLEPTAGDDRP
jgi:HEAT repeat protein